MSLIIDKERYTKIIKRNRFVNINRKHRLQTSTGYAG